MKTRIWIVLTLVAVLVAGSALVSPAYAGDEEQSWTLVGKGHATPPGGDDDSGDDGGSDVEGDPENWLGGQNRPADANDVGSTPRQLSWFMELLYALTFGLFR